MKLGFGKLNKQARLPNKRGGFLDIVTPTPLELQTGERLDLKTGLLVHIPEGYILSIQSNPALLVHKGLEVIGPIFVAPEDEGELIIPLRNTGNSQLNLQPGMMVASALLQVLEPLEVEEFNPEIKKVGRPGTKHPRKDPFKFKTT